VIKNEHIVTWGSVENHNTFQQCA